MAKYITNNIYFYRQKYIVFFVSNRKREIDGFKENIRDIGILYGIYTGKETTINQ